MSRIRSFLTVTAGAAAGLFLTALAGSATAAADTVAPTIPGLPGVVDQVIASSTSLPQQLLQTTTSALTGAPAAAPAPAGPAPLATATVNLPQGPAALTPGLAPTAAGMPAIPGLQGFQLPTSLSSVLPFPLPNLGGTSATVAAPSLSIPGGFLPTAPTAVPATSIPAWLPVSGLP